MPEPVEYPVKRGHISGGADLSQVMEEAFGSVKEDGQWYESSFKLINSIRARYEGKSKLFVINNQKGPKEIDFEKEMDDVEATRKAWNTFIDGATGYTAKERRKKAKDAAKKAD